MDPFQELGQEEKPASSLLEAALAYLARGLPIFPVCGLVPHTHPDDKGNPTPCGDPGKVPLVKWKAYQDRLPTEAEVREWFRRWPDANIGMATGHLSKAAVIDLDGELAQHIAQGRGYDHGPHVSTGRVGGVHRYFQWRESAPTIFARADGIDFRGEGGYAILPPSRHRSGNTYRWGEELGDLEDLPELPEWIDAMATDSSERAQRSSGGEAVEIIPQGQRNNRLTSIAGSLRRQAVQEESILEALRLVNARQCQPPLEDTEVRKIAHSIAGYAPQPDPPQLRVDGSVSAEAQADAPLYISAYELANAPREVERVLAEHFVWRNRTHWLYSSPGAGKTVLELAVLMHMAAGRTFHGLAVVQGGVCVIEEDSPRDVVQDYLNMLSDIYEIPLEGLPLHFFRARGVRLKDQTGYEYAHKVLASLPEKPAVFMIDACERVVPSETFTSAELDWLSRLFSDTLETGITNIMVDHTRKSPPGNQTERPDPLEMLYGGRSKGAILDVALYLSGAIKKSAYLTYPKIRGVEPAPVTLHFDGVTGFELKFGKVTLTESERAVRDELGRSIGRALTREEIEQRVNLPTRTVQNALRQLIARGIVNEPLPGLTPRYQLNLAADWGVFA
jgi:hypothetical protein